MPSFEPIEDIPPAQGRKRNAVNSERAPLWIRELAAQICSDYGVPSIPIRWQIRRKHGVQYLLGTYRFDMATGDNKRITMNVDSLSTDRQLRLTICHEVAHYILHVRGGRPRHSFKFWVLAWELYQRYGVDLDYAWQNETAYRREAAYAAPAVVRQRNMSATEGDYI